MAVVNGAGGFRESFIAEIDELRTKGLDLEKVVRQTMYESLGETPSEILFEMIGKSALLQSPDYSWRACRGCSARGLRRCVSLW